MFMKAAAVYIRNVVWRFNGWHCEFLTDFLLSIFISASDKEGESKGFKSVRSIHCDADGKAMRLVARCPGLTRLKLTFWLCYLVERTDKRKWEMGFQFRAMSVEKLVSHYQLERIFTCFNLEDLTLRVVEWPRHDEPRWEDECDPDPMLAMAELGQWIAEEFQRRAKNEKRSKKAVQIAPVLFEEIDRRPDLRTVMRRLRGLED
jgi:hypothetical protein